MVDHELPPAVTLTLNPADITHAFGSLVPDQKAHALSNHYDPGDNGAHAMHVRYIPADDAACEVLIIPTDETRMIARHTRRLPDTAETTS
jgi:hypothetical protein